MIRALLSRRSPVSRNRTCGRLSQSWLGSLAVAATAILIAGCGASGSTATTGSTTNQATSTSTGAQFDPGLVPAGTSGSVASTTSTGQRHAKKSSKTKKSSVAAKSSTAKRSSSQTQPGSQGSPAPSPSSPAANPSSNSGSGGGQTLTVTRTIAQPAPPPDVPASAHVPAQAHPPSSQPALSYRRFRVAGGNIGCGLYGSVVRCDIQRRVWSPPPEPRRCQLAWGQGLQLGSSGRGHFVCAGDSVLDPTGPNVVPNGYDDRFGADTCQVRSSTVTCFNPAGHGFVIGRTGYERF